MSVEVRFHLKTTTMSLVMKFILMALFFPSALSLSRRQKRFLGCVTIVDCLVTFKKILPLRFNFDIKTIYHRIEGKLKG